MKVNLKLKGRKSLVVLLTKCVLLTLNELSSAVKGWQHCGTVVLKYHLHTQNSETYTCVHDLNRAPPSIANRMKSGLCLFLSVATFY